MLQEAVSSRSPIATCIGVGWGGMGEERSGGGVSSQPLSSTGNSAALPQRFHTNT